MADVDLEKMIDRANLLGSGTSRAVYAVHGYANLVIKEMKLPFPGANFVEWLVWSALEQMAEDISDNTPNSDLQSRFARCYAISESGRLLVMERLTPLSKDDVFPPGEFPHWLNDVKTAAFGKDTSFGRDGSGQIKVMDYANVNFYEVLNPLNWERRY